MRHSYPLPPPLLSLFSLCQALAKSGVVTLAHPCAAGCPAESGIKCSKCAPGSACPCGKHSPVPAALPGHCHVAGNLTCFYKCPPNWRRACTVGTALSCLCSIVLHSTVLLYSTVSPRGREPHHFYKSNKPARWVQCAGLYRTVLSVLHSTVLLYTTVPPGAGEPYLLLRVPPFVACGVPVVYRRCAQGGPGASECPDGIDTSQGCVRPEGFQPPEDVPGWARAGGMKDFDRRIEMTKRQMSRAKGRRKRPRRVSKGASV